MHKNSYRSSFYLLVSLFFIWGFITALNDILIPHLKGVFEFGNFEAQLVNSAFFGAYFILALPASWIITKTSHKTSIIAALVIISVGALLFYPAAEMQSFPIFLAGLFVIASGITVLQVAANPYITLLGSPEGASSRLNLAQAFNSLGTILGPAMGAFLLLSSDNLSSIERAEAAELPYIVIALFMLLAAIGFGLSKLPKIKYEKNDSKQSIFEHRHLILGCLGIFLYVGAEVAIGSNIVFFLMQKNIAGLSEQAAGFYVPLYWGGAMVGRFIGSYLQSILKANKVLVGAASLACVFLLLAIFTSGFIAMWSLLAIGLFNSVMFPTIFSLSVNGLGHYTDKGSGFLIMSIVGGALIPLLLGYITTDTATNEVTNLQLAFLIPLCCYVYITYFGISGHKIKQQL